MKKRVKSYFEKIIGQGLNLLGVVFPNWAAESTLKLFIRPRRGRIQVYQEEFINSALQKKIDVEGVRLQTYYWQNGPETVLLAHGWESNSARWKNLILELKKYNFSVICIDAPAHGKSESQEFSVPIYGKALLQLSKRYRPSFIIAHSIGGSTVMFQQAQQAFVGLKKMVLLASPSELDVIMRIFRKRLGLNAKLMNVFETHFKQKFGYGFSDFSMLKLTKNFDIEALFIHDINDKIVNCRASKALVAQWQNADLVLTENLGHRLQDKSVYQAITNYLIEKK